MYMTFIDLKCIMCAEIEYGELCKSIILIIAL